MDSYFFPSRITREFITYSRSGESPYRGMCTERLFLFYKLCYTPHCILYTVYSIYIYCIYICIYILLYWYIILYNSHLTVKWVHCTLYSVQVYTQHLAVCLTIPSVCVV